jgi:hypothetical protein
MMYGSITVYIAVCHFSNFFTRIPLVHIMHRSNCFTVLSEYAAEGNPYLKHYEIRHKGQAAVQLY